ncbi:MAG: Heat shock protein GrpE [uncultured Sphingomonadaceae bacterium]|uniref:Protein GrpE n=1 Tax=uncultured Sphingomonadaceae bacterium TaxID=169976 RepID=A0A6J4TVR3_9SPHN|nr:MAG: Heat shock protein GrpE [uncultured Sphingomonadaceae bacterium]
MSDVNDNGEIDLSEYSEAPAADVESGDAARVAALESELAEAKQQVLYAHADTQNVRRRLEKDIQDARSYAATAFARDMLSVKDNLERALATIPADMKGHESFGPLVTGIEATARELDAVFARNGITRIESVGQKLDPNKHQAMMEMPSADAEPGTIVQEMQPGYMIKDRLLRPAMVGVARAG